MKTQSNTPKTAKNKGIFTISFDLELAWGTRGLYPKDYAGEREIIKKILALFEKYNISATWATTGHIFLNECKPVNGVKHPELKRKNTTGPNDWLLIDPCGDLKTDPFWYGPDVMKMVKDCKVAQEIGSHGFSHVWLDAPQCDRAFFESDLAHSVEVSKENGITPTSFVFPQNQIGYLDVLEKEGFKIFRSEDDNWYKGFPKLLRKIGNGIDNYFVPTARSVRPKKVGSLWSVAGSYFYIHKNSWAKFLPVSYRVRKAKYGLLRAALNGEVFHLWTHPFNIASSPDELFVGFEEIISYADKLRRDGKIEIMNMKELGKYLDKNVAPNPSALVLDAEQKSSLSAVRSLGQKGIRVISGGKRRFAISRWSRFIDLSFSYPSPLLNKRGFVDTVINEAKRLGDKPVIFCFSDETINPIIERLVEVEKVARIVLPEKEVIDIVFDKEKTLELAETLKIPIPKKYSDFPAVVKPRGTCYWNGNSGFQTTAKFAMNEKDLHRKLSNFKDKTGELPMTQEFLKGDEYGVEVLAKNGEILALCAHKRIRSMSPLGGASVLKETIDGGLMFDYVKKLIENLKWTGPAMIEFKKDSETGEFKLMEINGRFWGSLPLAVFSGVDFPFMYYQLALGETFLPDTSYKKGVVSRYFLGDVKNLLAVLFKNDPMREIAYPKKSDAIKNFFKTYGREYESDIFSWSDLKPFLVEFLDRFFSLLP
jgi:predicted ATP-grasp superfamily ATP-dependent carboligase/peptidoglycan/xylan/chitin deacetylase (PgdA/CDA1 family)